MLNCCFILPPNELLNTLNSSARRHVSLFLCCIFSLQLGGQTGQLILNRGHPYCQMFNAVSKEVLLHEELTNLQMTDEQISSILKGIYAI